MHCLRPSVHCLYLPNCGAVFRKTEDEYFALVGLDHSGKTTDELVGLEIYRKQETAIFYTSKDFLTQSSHLVSESI